MRACRDLEVCSLAICLQLVYIFHSTCFEILCLFFLFFKVVLAGLGVFFFCLAEKDDVGGWREDLRGFVHVGA